MSTMIALDLFLIALVLAACVHDLVERKIPNRLVLCGLFCAAALQLASATPSALLTSCLAGMLAGFLVFLPLYGLRGMAAGDVKLMAMAGAFTGPMLALEIALLTCCIGGVMALVIIVARGRVRATGANLLALLRPRTVRLAGTAPDAAAPAVASVGGMPYGPAIALATCAMLLIRHG
ncbi:MAG: A24 family peptidase [Telluria sp.]